MSKLEGFCWRAVMSTLIVLYILVFVDRMNISFAVVQMEKTYGISSGFMGYIFGIFFSGYLMLQVPVSDLSRKKGAKYYMVSSIVCGILSSAQGFVRSDIELFVSRFMVGVAECSRASSIFFAFLVVSPLIMSFVSDYIAQYVERRNCAWTLSVAAE